MVGHPEVISKARSCLSGWTSRKRAYG